MLSSDITYMRELQVGRPTHGSIVVYPLLSCTVMLTNLSNVSLMASVRDCLAVELLNFTP